MPRDAVDAGAPAYWHTSARRARGLSILPRTRRALSGLTGRTRTFAFFAGYSAAREDENSPLTVAAAVEGDAAPVGRPRELLGGRIGKHLAHRAGAEIQQPDAASMNLEDDARAVGRDGWRAYQMTGHRR